VQMLVDTVSKGGNLLLNIGPNAEGELPSASLERLEEIGQWMAVNGEAIYGTRAIAPYLENNIGFTRSSDGTINAIYLADEKETRMPRTIRIFSLRPSQGSSVTLLGVKKPMAWTAKAKGFEIQVPESVRAHPPCSYAWVFKFKAG